MTPARKKRLKLLVLLGICSGALITSVTLRTDHVSARLEDTIAELAPYRTWTKITKEPIQGAEIASITTMDVAAAGGG